MYVKSVGAILWGVKARCVTQLEDSVHVCRELLVAFVTCVKPNKERSHKIEKDVKVRILILSF